MRILRAAVKFILGALFCTILSLTLLLFPLSKITSYDYLKPKLTHVLVEQYKANLTEEQLSFALLALKNMCLKESSVIVPVGEFNATISCEKIKNASPGNLPNLVIGNIFNQIYYKTYDCQIFECLKIPSFVVSKSFNEFLRSILLYTTLATALSGIAYTLLLEGMTEKLKGIGFSLFFVGLPYFFLVPILNFTLKKLQLGGYSSFVTELSKELISYFLYPLVVGVVLLATGFALDFYLRKHEKAS